MNRLAFITEAEYSNLVGGEILPTTLQINEASEVIAYFLKNPYSSTWTDVNCPNFIKLATAYQIKYMLENTDDEYSGQNSFSIGKFSETKSLSGEYTKLSPKARRYCLDSGYVNRII